MLRAGRSDAAAASAVGEASLQTTIQIFATFFFFLLAFRFRKKKKKKRRARKGCVATYEVAVAARLESDGPSRERGNGRKGKKRKKMWPRKIADPTADCDGVSLFPAVVVVRVACARLELRTLPVY